MLLEVRNLTKTFPVAGQMFGPRRQVRAVSQLSFGIEAGQTFALVGESGCGKTTVSKMILLLEKPTGGSISFDGSDIAGLRGASLRDYRRSAQAVFQDPYASLNPRLKTSLIIAEPLLSHTKLSKRDMLKRVDELLDIVGLPASAANLYPHEFSGGQRQRIAIARALSLQPRFLVLDEPISALDVSIRSQVLNLLADVQERFKLTYLIIAHDLALVKHFSSHVGVMYLGELVESGPTEDVFERPQHPYTKALLASVLRPDPTHPMPTDTIKGEVPSPLDPPSGCKFHTRCVNAYNRCSIESPTVRQVGPAHTASCHLLEPAN